MMLDALVNLIFHAHSESISSFMTVVFIVGAVIFFGTIYEGRSK